MPEIIKESSTRQLLDEICRLIEESRLQVAKTTNATLTLLYWNIGTSVNKKILENQRAEYGQQVIAILSKELIEQYGSSFSDKNLRRMIQFATVFPDNSIVVSAIRQLR